MYRSSACRSKRCVGEPRWPDVPSWSTSIWMERSLFPTGLTDSDITMRKVKLCNKTTRRREGLWKRRWVEKSKSRLSHPAWKSRKERGIPTFPQPRLLLVNLNRTDHVLRKADIFIC